MERVKARATVDALGNDEYLVKVWGDEPHDFVREYRIENKSDKEAAFEGIARFVDEMESNHDGIVEDASGQVAGS